MTIGFLGVGRMGAPMASQLLAANWDVTVFDPAVDDASDLVGPGVQTARSAHELAACDITISMLPDAETTAGVLTELCEAITPGHIHIAMGTLGIAGAKRAGEIVENAGGRFADAPVSGSVALAASARISTMVGAERAVFDEIRPVLAAMTKEQSHVGPVGAGAALKLAVNIVIGANNQAIAEALVFAEANGVRPATAYDVLQASAVASPFLDYKRGEFLNPGEHPVSAAVSIIDKDLGLALDEASEHSVFLPATAAIRQILVAASAQGLFEQDMARVIDVVRHLSRTTP